MTDKNPSDKFFELRKRAEQTIKEGDSNIVFLSPEHTIAIIHDLQVHQAELELQNEELRTSQSQLEISRRKYADFYEFSPVGFLTLDHQGVIQEANLTFMHLIDSDQEKIIGHDLRDFIKSDSQNQFHFFFQSMQKGNAAQQGEITLLTSDKMPVRLEGMRVLQAGTQPIYRLTVSDITEYYQAELERARLFAAEQLALAQADRLTFRLSILQQFTATLSEAVTPRQVVDVMMSSIPRALRAASAAVALLTENGLALEYQHFARSPKTAPLNGQRIPLTDPRPIAEAVRTQKTLWLSDLQSAGGVPASTPIGAMICVPLSVKNHQLGGFEIRFERPQTFRAEEKDFALSLISQGALALDRARIAQQIASTQERQWLAQELHDAVTQTVFTISILAQSLPALWEKKPEQAREQTALIGVLAQGVLAEMRSLLVELRPDAIVRTPIRDLLKQLGTATRSRKVIEVHLDLEEGLIEIPPEVHVNIYRIAQESINNVVKHSRATRLWIRLRYHSDLLKLEIEDNGQGFDTTEKTGGFGLNNLKERAETIEAVLTIESKIGEGTRVEVVWKPPIPLSEQV